MLIFVHSSLTRGGAEVLRQTVVTEMARRRDIDFRVCLICGGKDVAEEIKSAGIAVDELGLSRSIYNPLTTMALAKYFRKKGPTIVQSSQFNTNFHTRLAARIANVPVVICEEHGIYHWKDWWHRLADRLLANLCDKIIAVSQAVMEFNVREIGISADKIEVMHNCLDIDRFTAVRSREEVRSELGLEKDTFVIGHVGNLRKEKGHDLLLRAFQCFSRGLKASLLLVGDGPLKRRLVQQAGELGISDKVLFVGSRSDVHDLYVAMDLFVFPSRNEALGIALLEAMYSGLPVIATKVGGIPEVVKDEETGLLVESEDVEGLVQAIQQLYEMPELRKQLGQVAKEYAAINHSPEVYVEKLQALYSQLLKEKRLV